MNKPKFVVLKTNNQKIIDIETLKERVDEYNWTKEAFDFLSSLPSDKRLSILNAADITGVALVINGDKIHSIYPSGYDVESKDKFIKNYNKQAIADGAGCSLEDVADWEDFSVTI